MLHNQIEYAGPTQVLPVTVLVKIKAGYATVAQKLKD